MSETNDNVNHECTDGAGTIQARRLGGCTGKGFMPGVVTNPKGRAPRRRFIEELATVLAEPVIEGDLSSPTKMRALAEKILEMAMQGGSVGVKAMAVLIPCIDPKRLRNSIRANNVNVLSVHGADGDGDGSDLRAELEEFVASLPGILRANALPSNADGAAPGPIARRVASRPLADRVRHSEANDGE